MTKTLVEYVKQGTHPVGCVIAHKKKKGVTLAWSKCMHKPTKFQRQSGVGPDKWNKEKAYSIAKNRVESDSSDYALSIADALTVSQENTPKIPSIIRKHLRKMAERAKRYFKNKKKS